MHVPTLTDRRPDSTEPLAWSVAAVASVAACLRVFAVLPNISPVGGLALFCGGRLRWWLAWVPPLAVMALADMVMAREYAKQGFYLWVYGSYLLYVVIGRWLARSNSPGRIAAASVLGAVQFYVLTNFGVWYGALGLPTAMYPPTAAGLVACYVAGLPFLGYTLIGDLGSSAVLFGAHAYLTRPAAATEPAPIPAAEEVRA